MKNDCLYIKLNKLVDLLIKIYSFINSFPTFDELQELNPEDLSGLDDSIYIGNLDMIDEDIHELENKNLGNISLTNLNKGLSDSDLYNEFKKGQFIEPNQQLYSTPPDTFLATLLAAVI